MNVGKVYLLFLEQQVITFKLILMNAHIIIKDFSGKSHIQPFVLIVKMDQFIISTDCENSTHRCNCYNHHFPVMNLQ